jgi:hypothetical protein
MLKNKMRAQESQVKELLQWNAKSPNTHNNPIVYTQTYPSPDQYRSNQQPQYQQSRGNPILQNNPIVQHHQQQGNNHMYTSSNQAYGNNNTNNNNNNNQRQNQHQMQMQQQYNSNTNHNRGQRQPPVNDPRSGRPNVTFPSYQKIEDNKDEIQRTDYELARLTQHRKIVHLIFINIPYLSSNRLKMSYLRCLQ